MSDLRGIAKKSARGRRPRHRVPLFRRRKLLKDSDRSGFKHFRIQLIRDGAFLVHPDEWDMPPPSDESLGGEGDGIAVDIRQNRNSVNLNPTVPDFED